ncbi:hypothetical protein GP2143_16766 [marine gamma proteobacterium HTCC2143]|jgi:hypothetical protein|uniref:Uncharacterized protein n=1 Tax=marine gamma proteobacterium HTCC2143 TaxID=247633 RepID=A0Y9X3_9GAMM|nr:hypothetical protein GP2143_16766 [marine gamma proteobacterium HTCC2143]
MLAGQKALLTIKIDLFRLANWNLNKQVRYIHALK